VCFSWLCVAKPLYDWNQTKGWIETDALIQHSEVTSQSNMHGPEYSLNVVFEYQFNGNNYKSDNSGLGSGIDTPAADMADWVAAHPVGTRTRCWVNPADPKQAVLERRLTFDWIAPALGLLMLGFGFFCFGDLIQTKWRKISGRRAFGAFLAGALPGGCSHTAGIAAALGHGLGLPDRGSGLCAAQSMVFGKIHPRNFTRPK